MSSYNLVFVLLSFTTLARRSLQDIKTIESMINDYEDEKNAMIATSEKEDLHFYDDFYDEMDPRIVLENSMNMIFFGPTSSFMRLDTESLLHILTNTKKQLIPKSRVLLMWDLITDGKTAAFLQGREFLALGSLLNDVPEEDLYHVNFGDKSVLSIFANHNLGLTTRKYGILVAAFKRYYGEKWYKDSDFINSMGYLLCGFPSYKLELISPSLIKKIDVEIFRKLSQCSVNQTKTLYNLATHDDAYGQPYKWSSHEITKLDVLFVCIPADAISSLRLEAIPAISKDMILKISQNKLDCFTKQQIFTMAPTTRRVFFIRMELKNSLDSAQIAKLNSCRTKNISIHLISMYLVTLLLE